MQAMTVQGRSAPIAQIALGRATRGEPMRATVVLPVAVTLTAKPKILSEKDDKSPVELTLAALRSGRMHRLRRRRR
jgi:hypothetical protein